jgi:hypothetical protein
MTTKKSKSTEVAKTDEKSTALAPVIDYGADSGAGLDDVGRDEAGIPFLKLLQAQSPEVIGPEGKIDGAQAGLFLNTGSGELSESVTIVPALRQHVYVEWRAKKQGGGVIALHQPGDPMVNAAIAENARAIEAGEPSKKKQGKMKFGEFYTPDGNELVETFYVFAVVLDDDVPSGIVVVPFTSTSIKVYKKKFINRMRYCMVDNGQGGKKNPPMFAHRVILTTGQESNDDGTWSNYVVTFAVENNAIKSTEGHDRGRRAEGRPGQGRDLRRRRRHRRLGILIYLPIPVVYIPRGSKLMFRAGLNPGRGASLIAVAESPCYSRARGRIKSLPVGEIHRPRTLPGRPRVIQAANSRWTLPGRPDLTLAGRPPYLHRTMPYITQDARADALENPVTSGELNFAITTLIASYMDSKLMSYAMINDVLGALEGAKLEFYRRVVVPYENTKIDENGDVYPKALTEPQ